MNGIIWLASYPKSGNTWLRVFFTNLRHNGDEPAQINDLDGGPIASDRGMFEALTGLEASDLTPGEIDRLRPQVYEKVAAEAQETLFIKVHDAYTYGADGRPLLSAGTNKAIYLLRNPLDVAASFARHNGQDLDTVIRNMADENYALSADPGKLPSQFRQRLLSWSGHVLSWVNAPMPVLVLLYEDMLRQPGQAFTRAARFAGLPDEPARVARAVTFSSFTELQRQEQEHGFKEKSMKAARFFQEGCWGSWRRQLTPAQAAKVIRDHGKVMQRYGYLTAAGEPVY